MRGGKRREPIADFYCKNNADTIVPGICVHIIFIYIYILGNYNRKFIYLLFLYLNFIYLIFLIYLNY